MKPDGRYSIVESDDRIVDAIRGQHISVPTIIITSLITAVASIAGTYFSTRNESSIPNAATKDDVAALRVTVDNLGNGFRDLTAKVNTDGERLRNDLELVKLKLDVLTKR